MPTLLTRAGAGCLKGLLVGPAGSGKTSLLSTAADVEDLSPTCFLDFEGGTLSVAHRAQNVYHERIRSTDQLQKVFWDIAAGKDAHADIKSYVIDSGSEFAALCLEEVAAAAYQEAMRNPDRASRESVDDLQLKDYGKATKRVRRLFRWFKDLDEKHVFITSLPQFRYPPAPESEQEKRRRDEAIRLGLIKPVQVVPDFTEKLGNAVVGFVDFAWYLHPAETKDRGLVRQLLTQPAGPVKFPKTRGALFADALGPQREVSMVDGVSQIEGKPALAWVYETFRRTIGGEG
jgi:hypothetical protein